MDLILLQKVKNLGNLGDKVRVKPGYGRNFLVPQGKAVPATATNIAEFEAKRAEYEANAQASHADAQARAAKFEGAKVSRGYIPKNFPGSQATEDQKKAYLAKVPQVADDVQARAAKNEAKDKVQKDAYVTLGINAEKIPMCAACTTILNAIKHAVS